jgi:hypothetical protein
MTCALLSWPVWPPRPIKSKHYNNKNNNNKNNINYWLPHAKNRTAVANPLAGSVIPLHKEGHTCEQTLHKTAPSRRPHIGSVQNLDQGQQQLQLPLQAAAALVLQPEAGGSCHHFVQYFAGCTHGMPLGLHRQIFAVGTFLLVRGGKGYEHGNA